MDPVWAFMLWPDQQRACLREEIVRASIMLWDTLNDLIHDQVRSCGHVGLGNPYVGVNLGLGSVGPTGLTSMMQLGSVTM